MKAWVLLALAGCGLPAPGPDDLARVRRIPPPPGPYVRATAVADIDGEKLSGTFDVLLLARTGPRPLVRLQLLPDLGGKALDLVASPDRLRGRFPHTGEEVDWALPDDAKAHPLLFIAITLLERFAPVTEDRLIGAGPDVWELAPVVEGSSVRRAPEGWRFGWGPWARWTRTAEGVVAEGFRLKLRDLKIEPLGVLDESLLKLK
jgi:hypothetical protein